jgi:hypothetical protein
VRSCAVAARCLRVRAWCPDSYFRPGRGVAEGTFVEMKKRSLEIDEDIAFQRKEWFAQRIGVALLTLFVFGALFGLTGVGGMLSYGEAGDPNGALHVEYERIVRRGAPATLTLHLRSSAPGTVRFWVSAPYLQNVTIEGFVPQPDILSVEQERHVYAIPTGSSEITVTLEVEHKTIGRIHGEVGLIGGPSARFSQLSLF